MLRGSWRAAALFCFLAAGTALPRPAEAASPGCQDGAPPQVVVQPVDGPVTYEFGLSAAQIAGLAGSAAPNHAGMIVRGLTTAEFSAQVAVRTRAYEARGGWCIAPSEVTVTIGFPRGMKVYVQREFPPGTCQHQAVLRHEHEHVRINRAALVDFLDAFRRVATAAAAHPAYPVLVRDTQQATDAAAAAIRAAVTSVAQSMGRSRDEQHALLDGPDSKAETQRACGSW